MAQKKSLDLYIIRHGSVNFRSQNGKISLHTNDEAINSEGTVQMDQLASVITQELLNEHKVAPYFDKVITSPTIRTIQSSIFLESSIHSLFRDTADFNKKSFKDKRRREMLEQEDIDIDHLFFPISEETQKILTETQQTINLEMVARTRGIVVDPRLQDVLAPTRDWLGHEKELWQRYSGQLQLLESNITDSKSLLQDLRKEVTSQKKKTIVRFALMTHEHTALILLALLQDPAIELSGTNLQELKKKYNLNRGDCYRVTISDRGHIQYFERLSPNS